MPSIKTIVKIFLLIFLLPISFSSFAQIPIWSFKTGSITDDEGRACKVAPNGNLYLAGRFSGTMDLDPGASVYNIMSTGNDDIFLACYSSSGNFLWGFGIGGVNNDAAVTIAVDDSSNVVIGGYIQSNVDFDPSPAVTVIIYSGGSGLPYYGDGFLAKYSSSGVFQWAKGLGGSTVYDFVTNVQIDGAQNIYACGEFTDVMTVSPTITWNSTVTGKGYIIKYGPLGNVIWAKVFGQPGLASSDTYPHCMVIKESRLYICGVFQGSSFFDPNNPGGSGSTLVSSGAYDAWFARYDTAGNYVLAKAITGTGNYEEALYIDADSQENIYLVGYTNSNALTFSTSSPTTSTVATPGGGNNEDIFLVKYDSLGVYQWGEVFGSFGTDFGYALSVSDTSLYMTGMFSNTVDFDATAALGNIVSNGNTDVYVCKYDLDGNYLCGFGIGNVGDDGGRGLDIDTSGDILITGRFSGSNTDFDPGPAVMNLSSNGLTDVYFAKYAWNNCGFISPCNLIGSFTDSSISCHTVLLTASEINAQGNVNYNWQFGDGATGTGNPVLHTYATSGSYQVTLIVSDSLGCSDTITHTISVNGVTADFTINNNPACIGQPVTFTSAATGPQPLIYSWDFGDGVTASTSSATHAYNADGTYLVRLIVSSPGSCADTVEKTVYIGNHIIDSFAVAICKDSSFLFGAQFIDSAGFYTAHFTSAAGCDSVVVLIVSILPSPIVGFTYTTELNSPVHFTNTSVNATTFLWEFGDSTTSREIHPIHQYKRSGTYNICLTGWSIDGCEETICKKITVEVYNVIDVPTGFTPNGDGINDILYVRGGGVEQMNFKIYNRWGERIFESNSLAEGWDGTYKGNPVDVESVAYVLQATFVDGSTFQKQGNISIIR